jgi:hypothetical protein
MELVLVGGRVGAKVDVCEGMELVLVLELV